MVAISLYRGNLHKVPDLPRRWPMPTRSLSLQDFKSLLDRRSRALSLLPSATTSNPNPNVNSRSENPKETQVGPETKVGDPQDDGICEEIKDERGLDGGVCEVKSQVPEKASDSVDGNGNLQALRVEAESAKIDAETSKKLDVLNEKEKRTMDIEENNVEVLNEKEKRKREVEEKLEVLNSKKHNLVQVLKQILNAEEELKRRNSVPGMTMRPSPLRVDASNDSGSMTRHAASRMGLDSNLGGEMEGGETDDVSNHNLHSRHTLRMSSTSPSSESPLRRPTYIQHNVVSLPSRASLVATGSPSRFAPTGHQGHPANLPAVSVTGTNYIASSPSPAASGGTSVFRDARLASPWN